MVGSAFRSKGQSCVLAHTKLWLAFSSYRATDFCALRLPRVRLESWALLTGEPNVRPAQEDIDDMCVFGGSSAESLAAISEGDAFLVSGKEGRFASRADFVVAAMACRLL